MILSILFERIVRAFCWTLVHACWQGLLLAVLTGIVILLTRRSLPVIRYNILSGLLCLFCLGTGVTFAWQWQSDPVGRMGSAGSAGSAGFAGSAGEGAAMGREASEMQYMGIGRGRQWTDVSPAPGRMGLAETSGERGLLGAMGYYLSTHAVWVVLIWSIAFMVKLVRMTANLGMVYRIRRYKVYVPAGSWKERVNELAGQLGIKRRVELLESALIQAPMMAGILKPVILVPLGLLTQLSPQQVEAVLLHELGHIRRKDYLVNLAFHLAEMIFFFHPAIWWISSLIKEERENCCDDIAVVQGSSKRDFISALVRFQEYQDPGLRYALAFPGSGDHLLRRVQRIVHRDDKVMNVREKCFAVVCLLIGGGLMMAFSMTGQVKPVVGHAGPEVVRERPADSGGVSHRAMARQKVHGGRSDGSRLAADPLTLVVTGDTLVMDTVPKQRQDTASIHLEKKQAELAMMEKRLEEQRQLLAKMELDLVQRQQELLEANDKLVFEQHGKLVDSQQQRYFKKLYDAKIQQENEQILQLQYKLNYEQTLQAQKQAGKTMKIMLDTLDSRSGKDGIERIVNPIIGALEEKGLISDRRVLSFSLTREHLIVNGVRQPGETFEYFKKRFFSGSRSEISYTRKADGSVSMSANSNKD